MVAQPGKHMKIPNLTIEQLLEAGKTKVIIDVDVDKKRMSFQLNEKRKIDHKMLNLMRNYENIDVL